MPITYTLANDITTLQIEAAGAGTFNNIQIESGSLATTFEPWSNICPISGRTGSSVVSCGKNLLISSVTTQYNDTWTTWGAQLTGNADGTLTLQAGTYTLSLSESASSLTVSNASGTVIANASNTNILTFTLTTKQPIKIAYGKSGGTNTFKAQLEYGSTATAYVAPVTPSQATLTFGQTVYGGQVDFKTGRVLSEWGYIASYNGETLPSEWISDRDAYEAGTTPTTGAEVAYKLATPTELTLTPAQLTMLKGYNYLSGDGEITITAYAINEEVGA